MFKYFFIFLCCCMSFPSFSASSAQDQLSNSVDRAKESLQTTSSDEAKTRASEAFIKKDAPSCFCKDMAGKSFPCLCKKTVKIKKRSNNFYRNNEREKNSFKETRKVPSDLIKESSTASEINPKEWQERNPQHRQNISDPIDEILGNKSKGEEGDIYQSQELVDKNGQPILSGGENDITLMKRVINNAQINKQEREHKEIQPNFGDIFVGVVAGAVITHSIGGSGSHGKKNSLKSGSKTTGCKAKCRAVGADWDGEYLDNGGCLCVM
ncbi:MAG: hypothetical protein EOM53_01065 [Alphaproteobacteria bacterium]|nr:hypothetical protein [Alphaproteobacteria bacterium]